MFNRKIGVVFLCAAGFLYTLERVIAYFSTYISNIGKIGISVDQTVIYPGFFDNSFVVMFVILGVVFLLLGLIKKNNKS